MWNPLTVYIAQQINTYTSIVNTPPTLPKNHRKRQVLLIQCHPVQTSFSNALESVVQRGLRAGEHEVRIRRLYFQGSKNECYGGTTFNAVLSSEEQIDYHNPGSTILRENNGRFEEPRVGDR